MRLAEAEAAGNQSEARKFRVLTDGPHAAELLANLKQRVKETEDKVVFVYLHTKAFSINSIFIESFIIVLRSIINVNLYMYATQTKSWRLNALITNTN